MRSGQVQEGIGTYHAAVEDTAGGGDDLASSTVDGIRVQGDIVQVEADPADVLVAEGSLLGGPLESSDDRVLDLGKVLRVMSFKGEARSSKEEDLSS